jgi:hypothetical protein
MWRRPQIPWRILRLSAMASSSPFFQALEEVAREDGRMTVEAGLKMTDSRSSFFSAYAGVSLHHDPANGLYEPPNVLPAGC